MTNNNNQPVGAGDKAKTVGEEKIGPGTKIKEYIEKEKQKKIEDAAKKAANNKPPPPKEVKYQEVNPNTPAGAASIAQSKGAAQGMANYDQYTQNALGASPAEAMQKAQAAAAQGAQGVSDQAIQQSIKAGRTGGMMGGQAALAATGQAANAYGQAQQAGQQQYFNTAQLGGQLGAEMSGRLQRTADDATQRYGIQVGANTNKYGTDVGASQQRYSTDVGAESSRQATEASLKASKAANKTNQRGQNIGLLGSAIGAGAGLLALSDETKKEDIQPKSMTGGLNKLQSFAYKYKPGTGYDPGRQEGGVMAQDLEKTAMKSAVTETPEGKMIDTKKLSTMNTGALGEHEQRLQQIEKLVKSLGEIPAPKGKK